ncbi:MAG: RNA polymerase sigma factor [Actinomycetota bacterium]
MDVAGASDDYLARRAGGDIEAFGELYRRHVCAVFRFVRSKTGNEKTAEDLTAQVFFKALRSADTFSGTGTYESWIFRIARNCVATWHRTRERDMAIHELPDPVDPAPTPASRLIDQEARGVVWNAVAKLPVRQREAVVLRYVQECSIDEIAASTDRSPGAVRVLLHRARQRLRKEYEGRLV